jgi:hypothetical protein
LYHYHTRGIRDAKRVVCPGAPKEKQL